MKWLGAVATTMFLALVHQGCAVSAGSAGDEAAIESESEQTDEISGPCGPRALFLLLPGTLQAGVVRGSRSLI